MSPPHLNTETDPVSETCLLVSRIPDDGQSPKPEQAHAVWGGEEGFVCSETHTNPTNTFCEEKKIQSFLPFKQVKYI
jgi:hypothetical protein